MKSFSISQALLFFIPLLGAAQEPVKPPSSAAAGQSGALPDVKALMGHLEELDGPAMHHGMDQLILAGEPGFAILHRFLDDADIDHPKILKLTHDPQMIFAMLRVGAQRPDETAKLFQYLIRVTKPKPESFIRREIYNFLPVFLNHHVGKYAEARRDLEEDILYQLEKGGEYNYKVFIAMKDIGFFPPCEKFLPMLKNPGFTLLHSPLVQYLGGRKAEGMKVLLQHAMEAPSAEHPSVRDALLQIASMETDGGPRALLPLLESPNLSLRSVATRAYFNSTRGPEALELVIRYLSSSDELKQKRVLVSLLSRKNEKLLALLQADPARVSDPAVRELLAKKGPPPKEKSPPPAGGEIKTGPKEEK